MKMIEQQAYAAAQTILAELSSIHVAIASVLDGTIDGEIWVDRPVDPRIAIAVNGDAYFLAGNPDVPQDTLEGIGEVIPDWAYLFIEDRWLPHLPGVWRNASSLPHPRIRMGHIPGSPLPEPASSPEGFEIVPINRTLFDRAPGNLDRLEECIEGWASPGAFFDGAIGYCALHDGNIVSHSVTDSVSGTRCEIGVGTDAAFRRRGLGRAVVAATAAECIRRGIPAIEWHSHASNLGSLAIGRQVGFIELDRHTAFSCSLPAENVGDLDPEHCRELAAHFEEASAQIGWCRFHAAGARALAGDHAAALENVRILIESDWEGQAEWLEAFWALQPISDDPGFQTLLAAKRARD